jgi:hypothetical protein
MTSAVSNERYRRCSRRSDGAATTHVRPIVGRSRVAQPSFDWRHRRSTVCKSALRTRTVSLDLFEVDSPTGRRPPKFVLAADLDAEGLIASLWVVAT